MTSEAPDFIAAECVSAWVKPFRGEIYDYARQIDLQSGYAVKGKFDIASANHLREPFEAIKNPSVRMVSILGAVQTLKTLLSEIVIPYTIEHDPGDILFLLDTDPKAKEMAETRLMPLLKTIPAISKMFAGMDRHDKTKTEIHFSHCRLLAGGLNTSNVQSHSYRYVIMDEAWMGKANGLLRHGMARATQYPDTKKIIVLGQGGIAGEDADMIHSETDRRDLNFACPSCGKYQPFELAKLRDDDFPIESLRGTYSGLSWDKNDQTFRDGRWNYEAAGNSAHIRCHHCDHRIDDTPENRRKLMDSYKYIATNPNAPHHSVGFHWNAMASVRIPLKDLVVEYLRAKFAKDSMSYNLPMQEFYQKRLAIHWSDDMAQEYRATKSEEYDHTSDWPDEKHRVLLCDCQRDLEKFYLNVWAMSAAGESRMLARRTVGSFAEIAAVQQEFKILDQRVYLDCGYRMTDVLTECTKHFHVGTVQQGGRTIEKKLMWQGLKGSDEEGFIHINPKNKSKETRIYSKRKLWNVNEGKSSRPNYAEYQEFSALHTGDLLYARREGHNGAPKFLTLPDTLPQEDIWSYFMQMRSEKRVEEYKNGMKKNAWQLVKQGRPNHEWDLGKMLMAVQAILRIIGSGAESVDATA